MNHWSNYWSSSKTLNSFSESDISKGYTGEIKRYWFDIFSKLKPGSKIVDIGCGNGALACLAVEYSNSHNLDFEVHGIDAADIKPIDTFKDDKKLLGLLSKVTFHPKTPAEKMPFKKGSIDVFISQFGFEYSDILKTLSECHKALADNGSIHIMAHHPNSVISQDTKSGAHVLNEILHTSPLFIQVDLLLDIATQVYQSGQYKAWNRNPYNQSIIHTIKWILDTVKKQFHEEKYANWLNDILNRVIPILQNLSASNPQLLRQHLAHDFNLLDQHRARLEEQIKATLTNTNLKELEENSLKLNLSTVSTTFNIENQPFAWSITIE